MPNTQMSVEEVAQRGKALYAESIRERVETEENIGKMVIIDVETGEYGVDATGLETSRRLHRKRLDAPLYGIRIGYNVSGTIGGLMERIV